MWFEGTWAKCRDIVCRPPSLAEFTAPSTSEMRSFGISRRGGGKGNKDIVRRVCDANNAYTYLCNRCWYSFDVYPDESPHPFFFQLRHLYLPSPRFLYSLEGSRSVPRMKKGIRNLSFFLLARTFYLILPSSVGYFYPREVRVKWMFPGIKSSSRSRALWLFHLSSYVTSAHGQKRRCNDGGVATVLLSPGNECGPRRIDTVYIVLPSSEISCERVFVVVGRKNSRVTDNRYPPRLFPRSSMKIHDWKMRRMVSALSCQFIDFLSISTINWYRISVFTT